MTDLVRYSRAGDEFHYRWAARRCLRMIEPNSRLKYIVIEGSKEPNLAGEYVMDATEYSELENKCDGIAYFQLKHSTVRTDEPFNLSDLQGTIEGFSGRFREHISIPDFNLATIQFSIITNRPFSDSFKSNIIKIRNNEEITKQFQETLEKYTNLNGDNLQKFCSVLELIDTESDYIGQKYDLQCEMAAFFAGHIEHTEINDIITLIREEALPDAKRKILPEDILKRFGISSKQELFPAPAEFEILNNPIQREQHTELLDGIIQNSTPIIIHAAGGVGKSVASRQLASSLPNGSVGIVYDSFGSGTYRNRSKPRHRYRDALVQIVNEIAVLGLCAPLIPRTTDLDDALLKAFLDRISVAGKSLQQVNENALLVIFIDAADNAEMAAAQFSESCFVKHLLRETVPNSCRIVALCRTERIGLLKPKNSVQQIELLPFSETETLAFLLQYFSNASAFDANELHRLTAGNPRVQANAIHLNSNKLIAGVLTSLGSLGLTVDDQIAAQLNHAIDSLKENHTEVFEPQIDAICLGLANLQPFIPIEVLATAANVNTATIRSFIADLGRPLWLTDNFVQFRDEPTETWFREKFSATSEQLSDYVNRLKPLAIKFPYVAEVLPSLLLQSDNYKQLIELALSDDSLPEDSPIDKRNIRVYRLQFAFKAALKQKKYADAAKLALLAGEEVAGDKRQLELLSKNVDLIEPLQSKERVQELAFRRLLSGAWTGSNNVYSASLLSTVQDFKGEARNHLRAADNWLKLYFEEQKKDQNNFHNDKLNDEDIVELAFTRFNLFGSKAVVQFILSWKPPEVIFRITGLFIKRFIDAGNFSVIDEIAEIGCLHLYLILAITHELIMVGKFPPASVLNQSLILLCHKCTRIKKLGFSINGEKNATNAIISFSEACVVHKLCHIKILRVLRLYQPSEDFFYYVKSDYGTGLERDVFLRRIALNAILSNELDPNLDTLMPKEWQKGKPNHEIEQDIKKFKEVMGSLLPWYIVRARALAGDTENFDDLLQTANKQSKQASAQRYRQHDNLPFEISRVHFETLVFNSEVSHSALDSFVADLQKFRLSDRLNAVRTAFRLPHLSRIKNKLQLSCRESIKTDKEDHVETRANEYIELARAVLSSNPDDAKVYFDDAIEIVSKFGDEIVERWEAVVAIAERAAESDSNSAEIAYLFIRCAELVGDHVAREKHFGRNKAIEVCFKLHPASAFAALSRWRDRDVGWLDRQLPALAQIALQKNIITPVVAWSLSAFSWEYDFVEFAVFCLEKETDLIRRQYILDSAVKKLRLENTDIKIWKTLNEATQRFSLKNAELDTLLDFYSKHPEVCTKESDLPPFRANVEKDTTDWNSIFANLELTDSKDLNAAIDNFDAIPRPYCHEEFWQEAFKRIPENKVSQFLESIVSAESADYYDVEIALSQLPKTWREKASVKKIFPKIIKTMARRFTVAYTNHYRVTYFIQRINADSAVLTSINEGVLEGLADSCYLVDASTLFGFSNIVSPHITTQESTELLDFALGRFEEHIDSNYADGCWAEWMIPPDTIIDAFTGFIWSGLGSPRSEIRWRAVHCVRKLAEMECEPEIDSLINWMNQDNVGAFGSHQYPFYNLHARQYLFIAIARVAIDDPKLFKKHHAVFIQHALYGISHALIQKYATEIALSVEKAFPDTYTPEIIEQLHQVNISQFPIQKVEGYGNTLESPWHIREQVDKNLKLHFSYDFDRYWFEPLGRVFGISAQQVEELAREILLKEWRIKIGSEYIEDPRDNLWRSHDYDRETWHSNYNYPRTDNYSFCLSYHAMLAVSAKLLKEMPVVHSYDWEENEWLEWLQRHCLTRTDGRWLADRRDPAPLARRMWIYEKKSDDWRWEIKPEDFLDGLLLDRDGETWLNINSNWYDNDNDGEENFYISSALVSPTSSSSLLNALTTCANPHDYKLPNYQEDNMEIKTFPFELQGWIYSGSQERRLDEFDPYAGDIYYPSYQIGQSFVEKFGLISDLEQREWYLPNETKASLISELWSEKISGYKDDPTRHGNRLTASLAFLKKLCSDLELDLIIQVQIKRSYLSKSYNSRKNDGIEYPLPYCKIYILSSNGTLKDTRTSYQLR